MPTLGSLAIELIGGITLVAVLAARSDLDDFTVVFPAFLVVGGVSVLAFFTRSRPLFWCGTVGAIAGAVCPKPHFCALFNANAHPGDTTLIWARMVGEINFQYALAGGILGAAAGYGIGLFATFAVNLMRNLDQSNSRETSW